MERRVEMKVKTAMDDKPIADLELDRPFPLMGYPGPPIPRVKDNPNAVLAAVPVFTGQTI
jgi:hypothetical protein